MWARLRGARTMQLIRVRVKAIMVYPAPYDAHYFLSRVIFNE
jgi:hypothetical protein